MSTDDDLELMTMERDLHQARAANVNDRLRLKAAESETEKLRSNLTAHAARIFDLETKMIERKEQISG